MLRMRDWQHASARIAVIDDSWQLLVGDSVSVIGLTIKYTHRGSGAVVLSSPAEGKFRYLWEE
jgi:hypothetical protein